MLRSGTEAEAAGQELGSLWEELESLAAATEAERTRRMVRAAEDMPAGWLELGLSERRRRGPCLGAGGAPAGFLLGCTNRDGSAGLVTDARGVTPTGEGRRPLVILSGINFLTNAIAYVFGF